MRKRSFIILLLMLVSTQSLAALINTSIGKYDVTTIVGSYDSSFLVLQDTPWWNDATLAGEFAMLSHVAGLFPLPTSYNPLSNINALFQYDTELARATRLDTGNLGYFGTSAINNLSNLEYAVATRVPEPSMIALFAAGFFWLRFARRRQA